MHDRVGRFVGRALCRDKHGNCASTSMQMNVSIRVAALGLENVAPVASRQSLSAIARNTVTAIQQSLN